MELGTRLETCAGTLDLSGLALNSDIKGLADVLKTKPVTHLVLADCLLDPSAAEKLFNVLSGLSVLDVRGNDLRGKSVSALAGLIRKCSTLHTIIMEWNSLGNCEFEFEELCNAITTSRSITKVDLRNNQLGNSHGQSLAQLIAANPPIRSLDLRWNRIGASGGREIVEAIKHNSTIEELLLEGNGLSKDLVDSIRVICERNRCQSEAVLRGHKEASFLLNELEMTKTLAMSETQKLEGQLSVGRREKTKIEGDLWDTKEILIQLRSKLEIAESQLIEKDALLAQAAEEMRLYRQESKEIAQKQQVEIDDLKQRGRMATEEGNHEKDLLKKKLLETEAERDHAVRDSRSYKSEIENLHKNIESERRNATETRENDEMHFQRNLNRANENVERERAAKRANEEECVSLRQQLADVTLAHRQHQEESTTARKEIEFNLKQQRDDAIKQVETSLQKERTERLASDRALDAARTQIEDLQTRMKCNEDSRDRLTSQLRTTENSIEPTKKSLENANGQLVQMKENHLNAVTALRAEADKLRQELHLTTTQLAEHQQRQRVKEDSLRIALTQYLQ